MQYQGILTRQIIASSMKIAILERNQITDFTPRDKLFE
jgi:hypothetical protein